jgi:hypothetical protein
MMRVWKVGLIGAVLALLPATSWASDTYAFVNEYVRGLAAQENIRAEADRDMNKSQDHNLAGCVRSTEAFKLELSSDSELMRSFKLDGQFAQLPSQIADMYGLKLEQYRQLGDDCSLMLAGPKPGFDYGTMMAETPKITARIQFIDKTIFDAAAPLVFLSLIDLNRRSGPDTTDHLKITKAQRDTLIHNIEGSFGKELNAKGATYTVQSAGVVYDQLTNEKWKSADDPN